MEELSSLQRVLIIFTEYLKDSMPGHQNIFQGTNHVPDASKDKAPELKKNASTASKNYLCNKSIHCAYLTNGKCICPYFPCLSA